MEKPSRCTFWCRKEPILRVCLPVSHFAVLARLPFQEGPTEPTEDQAIPRSEYGEGEARAAGQVIPRAGGRRRERARWGRNAGFVRW